MQPVDHSVDSDPPLPLDDAFMQDPYPIYEQLRRVGPVRRATLPRGLTVWLVTRYADARAALSSPSLGKNSKVASELFRHHIADHGDASAFPSALAMHMLNSDPPDHTRMRTLVNKAFTARTVARLRPRIEEITEELLAGMAGQDTVELLDAFAFPLPITVICELLGVPDADRGEFRSLSNTVLSQVPREELQRASAGMARYLSSLIERKRNHPGDDLLTALIEVRDHGDRLDEVELVAMAFLLMVAGHETTVNLIGNGVLALLRDPDQLAALRADPTLLPGAIEEFLRFESPVNLATTRFTTEPLVLGDVVIPEGEFVLVSLGSANRDAERFPDADRLDVTRKPAGHVAFGHGIHYCVGAPLARLEGQVAIGRLIARFPQLRLAAPPDELVWRNSTLIRGLLSLPVSLGALDN